MENVLENVKKRTGTTDGFTGSFYEIKVIFLFMIRACLNNVKFIVASNVDGFGNFDDLVADCVLPDGTKKLICLQSKHLKYTEKDKINLGTLTMPSYKNFNLNKYRESIINNGNKISNYKDGKVDLILYTNVAIADSSESVTTPKKRRKENLSWCNVDKNDILCKLLDTSNVEDCVRKFSQSGNDLLLEKIANNKKFLQKITIFSLQCREGNIDAIIKNGIKQLVGKHTEDIIEYIYENMKSGLEKNFKNAIAETFCNESFVSWIWAYVLKIVPCLSLENNLMEFSSNYNICDDRIKEQRKQIFEHRTLVIKSENTSTFASALEVYQAVKGDSSHMFVNLQDLKQVLPLLKFCKDLIIVDCSEVTELGSNAVKEFKKILSVNERKKAILLVSNAKQTDLDSIGDEILNYNFDFQSLMPSTKQYILERYILLQGQNVRLCELMDESDVCDVIDCATIEKLIKHEVVEVGAKLPLLEEETKTCYIKRTYNNTHVLDVEVLDVATETDVFVVCVERASDLGPHESHFVNYEQQNEINTSKKWYFIKQNEVQNYRIFEDICTKHPKKDIHLLKIVQNHIVWIKTVGSSVENLGKYVTACTLHTNKMSDTGESEETLVNTKNKLNIIIDSAGKGKTTALLKIAENLKTIHKTYLVLHYDLNSNEMFNIFKQLQSQKNDQINAEQILRKYFLCKYKTFELEVILHLLRNNKVFFCFDGFDEISQKYDTECMWLIKNLQSIANQIWLTSREHMKSYIQQHLPTFPIRLLSITEKEQIYFYIKYFKFHLINKNKPIIDQEIEDFANEVYASIASVDESIVEFMGIPLLTKMLASINLTNMLGYNDSIKHTKHAPVKLNNLYDLYHKFFELSIIRHAEEKKKENINSPYCQLETKESLECHMLIAFTSLMDKDFHKLLNERETKLSKKQTKLKKKIDGVGIITSLDEDSAKFLHFTFAEFLVANFISNKLNNCKFNSQLQNVLNEILNEDRWRMVRKFLNYSPYILRGAQDTVEKYQIQCETPVAGNSVCVNMETKNKYNPLLQCVDEKKTSLIIAIEEKNCNIAEFTIECLQESDRENYISFRPKDKSKASALHIAVDYGHKEEAELLLNYNADNFNKEDSKHELLLTAADRGNDDMATLLLDRGADVKHNDEDGTSALIRATKKGHVEVMTVLLDRGANVNLKDKDGKTALILAAEIGRVDVVTLLLDRGADVRETDKYNKTAILTAARWSTVETIKLLHERGARLDDKDNYGHTLLMYSACNRRHDVIMYVISQGRYEIDDRDSTGRTALHYTAVRGHSLNMKTLLDAGAHINSQDDEGETPLHWALKPSWPSIQCIQYLCKRGADCSVKNKSGETVLGDECDDDDDDEIKEWLRQNINKCDIEVQGELSNCWL